MPHIVLFLLESVRVEIVLIKSIWDLFRFLHRRHHVAQK